MKTNLAQTLNGGRLAVTAECLPTRGSDAAAIRKLAACFPPRLDAVVVADNPDEVRGSALACAAIFAGEKIQPVLSMITRDRNRIALESDVLGAAALGIGSVLCLSGEHQSLGAGPQAAGAYDVDSVQLMAGIKSMCETGAGFAGGKLACALELFVGAAAHPYLRPMELNLLRLRKKVRAGAAFFMTQAIFDVAGFSEWMDAIRAAGIDKQAAIIASVLPLTSVDHARRLAAKKTYGPVGQDVIDRLAKATDAAKEGIAIAAEMARKARAIAGVRGIHVLCGGCEHSAAAVIQEAGLTQN
ncbi:MAG: methylenetetrahydrofolate reductase [Tepidisphaerales bacterium]